MLKAWETNLRLFASARGTPFAGDARRLAFTEILPANVSAYVTMHMDQYAAFVALKKFTVQHVKVHGGSRRFKKAAAGLASP